MKIVVGLMVAAGLCAVHITRVSMPKNYSGWIFAIEKPDTPELEYYKLNSKGVVYIPRQTGYNDSIKFRLYDSSLNDVSSNVKLFKVSDYKKTGEAKPLGLYIFYYPSPEELKLPTEQWFDIDFTHTYTEQMIKRHQKLEDSGYFE